jgi:hypothetical protein
VVNEKFSEQTQILAVQLRRQRSKSTQRIAVRVAEPHQSPRACSYLSDIPSVRVVRAFRRMTKSQPTDNE